MQTERIRINIDEVAAGAEKFPMFKHVVRERLHCEASNAIDALCALGKKRCRDFGIDEQNRFAFENAAKWLIADPNMKAVDPSDPIGEKEITGTLSKGLYVAGTAGGGKSWLLDLLGALGSILELKCEAAGVRRTITWASIRSEDIVGAYAVEGDDVIRRYKQEPILCIQDFGTEPKETLYMGNRTNVMRRIIEARGDRSDLLTLFSSNIPIESDTLDKMYGGRVVDRLRGMCNYLVIKGNSRRK